MATYKTPDVYVEEIPLFPPSVAEVETAVPAFIGYTEKALKDGVEKVELVPTEVLSLVEYEAIFGKGPPAKVTNVELDANSAFIKADVESRYYTYDAIRMFFSNGGGKCYIISIGSYGGNVDKGDFIKGLTALEKKDEPTIILFPDAVLLEDNLYDVQKAALNQCERLQDRVCIFDMLESKKDGPFSWSKGVDEFRTNIGINNLKYGAAYTPYLKTKLIKKIRYADIRKNGILKKAGNPISLSKLTSEPEIIKNIEHLDKAISDGEVINGDETTDGSIKKFLKNSAGGASSLEAGYSDLQVGFRAKVNVELAKLKTEPPGAPKATPVRTEFKKLFTYIYDAADQLIDEWAKAATVLTDYTDPKEATVVDTIRDLVSGPLKDAMLKLNEYNKDAQAKIGGTTFNQIYNGPTYKWDAAQWGDTFKDGSIAADNSIYPDDGGDDTAYIKNMRDAEPSISAILRQVDGALTEISNAAVTFVNSYEDTLVAGFPLFKNIIDKIASVLTVLPPSGAIAGVYAMMDRTRGVWKAPANVSLNNVSGPTELINNKGQENLNVDVVAGKSINAIRAFTGKGILVWGARTLAGNDNEWRYISVRRFFNMVEESVKKSTYWAVFEPNDANTWIKVKSMIENYLIQKWRDGALAGSKPDEAFYVKVGLGVTMTPQDILEGRMNVEIGMAVVRPAEFIILKFSHKMQES